MKYIRKEQEDYFFTKFAKKALALTSNYLYFFKYNVIIYIMIDINTLWNDTKTKLSARLQAISFEVWIEKLKGKNYMEIAEHLDRSPKSVDNALQRIKKKIVAYLEK